MLSQEAKDLFCKLELEVPPVALKFCFERPAGVARVDRRMSFCEFVKHAQQTGQVFYTTKEDDDCFGKMVLGMIPKPPLAASGQAGYDFGVFKSQAPNARLYHLITTLTPGAVNYVVFAPLPLCEFDPDLVICVAPLAQAEILLRATSYISGDLWESRTSSVLSCAWMYSYPYVSGKVNFCITGMHHGMKRRGTYPPGRYILAIPYQKWDEVVKALGEMDWELIAMRKDQESVQELARRMEHWKQMSKDVLLEK